MANPPRRLAQTSTEVKRLHKKSGPFIPEHQQKQLQRALELDERAARLREAEDRRRAAKTKRAEREEKEARARKQMGLGLATQLIGYSHTQAQLKSGMEAFLGVKKRKEEEQRKRNMELTKQLDAIVEKVDKEPWDDESDDDMPLHLPDTNVSSAEQWADDDLDDDVLLEAQQKIETGHEGKPTTILEPPAVVVPKLNPLPLANREVEFARVHGPINRAIEAVLDQLPEPLIELLSQDLSMKLPEWNPELSLLHKLYPLGLPPHRLRVKVGCNIILLRDLVTSSPLSKSQHLRILRVENDRLECLVLDGQLEGTKTFLTKVAFHAKFKNQDQFPFQRIQFPVRVVSDFQPSTLAREKSQSGFKLPVVPTHARSTSLPQALPPVVKKPRLATEVNPKFKVPGLPPSRTSFHPKVKSPPINKHLTPVCALSLDGWDDFLESGTQIARELAAEPVPPCPAHTVVSNTGSVSIGDCLPPLSTQDFDFSLEDLDNISPIESNAPSGQANKTSVEGNSSESLAMKGSCLDSSATGAPVINTKHSIPTPDTSIGSVKTPLKKPSPDTTVETKLAIPLPPRRPPSVSDRPGLKRKGWTAPHRNVTPQPKRPCVASKPHPLATTKTIEYIKATSPPRDFMLSTQEVASFFDDDDTLSFGSPPVPV